jgi:hypothetical protein
VSAARRTQRIDELSHRRLTSFSRAAPPSDETDGTISSISGKVAGLGSVAAAIRTNPKVTVVARIITYTAFIIALIFAGVSTGHKSFATINGIRACLREVPRRSRNKGPGAAAGVGVARGSGLEENAEVGEEGEGGLRGHGHFES